MENIFWPLLSESVTFYQNKGYRYKEVPWIVPNVINMITCPHEDFLTKIMDTNTSLIGSAEQSFLDLQFNNNLPKGKYVTCSPCFRKEAIDKFHFPYFMKVELYQTDKTDNDSMYALIQDAEDFFHSTFGNRKQGLRRVVTPQGVDIELNGIEIGSYGTRSFSSHKWICGTGLALPRFSQALENIEYYF